MARDDSSLRAVRRRQREKPFRPGGRATMSRRAVARFAVLTTLLALGLAYFLVARTSQDEPDERADEPAPLNRSGFREEGLKAGITFRMSFLPEEQGAKFK